MEVFEKLSGFISGLNFKETRKEEDEKGLLLLTVETVIGDDRIELEYTREGQKPKGKTMCPIIYKAYYDPDGIPFKGYSIRKKEDGTWEGLDD